MPLQRWWERASTAEGAPSVRRLSVNAEQWSSAIQDLSAAGGRLLALWAGGQQDDASSAIVYAALQLEPGVLVLELQIAHPEAAYPGLEQIYPAASRMQRAMFDLSGVRSTDPDRRPWLRHDAWPERSFPLRAARVAGEENSDRSPLAADAYPFLRVQGDGVHEIAVGPVHAGIIEPGHFRFSVVGEKVLRLEERLGYVHKGIERRFTELPILEGHRLAARVSGDSAVAFSWAYCQALEGIAHCAIPPRAAWLRALCLELERIANHLGDLGALGNDVGFAFGMAQFSRLKEEMLRAGEAVFGQRYLMDALTPGGMRVDIASGDLYRLAECADYLAQEVRALREIYDEHDGVRDRFSGAGRVPPELATRLGLTGLAGRASGQEFDARIDMPCAPYDELAPARSGRTEGDVAARVALRFDEIQESCRLIERILGKLPGGSCRAEIVPPQDPAVGLGVIEGWRGPVLVALESGRDGAIRRCHAHDPSWQNWPVLEHAIIGNIVADFPLINKSFNLSYSGHDL